MRFQPARYSSPHFLAMPYGESGRNGKSSVDRAGALAVAGSARRGEDHLSPAAFGRGEDVHRADDVDRRVVLGALHRRLDVGLGGEVEDHVGLDRERLADVVLEQLGLPGSGSRACRT